MLSQRGGYIFKGEPCYKNKGKIELIQKGLAVGIVLLFLGSSVVTMLVPAEQQKTHACSPYDCYHLSDTISSSLPLYVEDKAYDTPMTMEVSQTNDDGPMNSPWPMYCHDVRHTGQSLYSTANTTDVEKWRISLPNWVEGSPVIDGNDTVYIGCDDFFALYANGTIKWNYRVKGLIWSAPAIEENGVLYVGSVWGSPNYLYAFYPNGTLKWNYWTGNLDIYSSPVIGDDGIIYFGCGGDYPTIGYITALYPNGTLRWQFQVNAVVYSSPAIGNNGIIYCGTHDGGLYALYPNNGTIKWRFGTGGWIRTAPCIAEDGTIYCVSLDNYLYAIYPDGTMKWRTNVGAGTSPTIGQDGTVYAGWDHLYAIDPTDGAIKWVFDPGPNRCIEGGTPCHSSDNIIYFGTRIQEFIGGEIIAVNPNGTERWRKLIANQEVQSAPAIGEDGTIYIGSSAYDATHGVDFGYLYAFGPLDPNAPTAPTITGQTNGKIKKTYTYIFTSASPLGNDIYYTVDWGDGTTTDWLGPYASGASLTLNHSWGRKGTYTIQARAQDTENLSGPWGTLSVTMPCSYETPFQQFWIKVFERFPNAFPVLRHLLYGYH
jgi:outer membrane protein assembly factor BamB